MIGNSTLKGVSGGEKRRVTLGEMLVTGSQVLCADEISTGLDAAATFDITMFLQTAAHILHKPIVVALLQPPPEVIDLFDDIVVMADGQVIYHGPRSDVLAYFEGLGFRCPHRKDLGDFLQELPTKNGLSVSLPMEELKKIGIDARPPRTPSEFAARWRESAAFKADERHVDEVLAQGPDLDRFNHDNMPQNSFWKSLYLCIEWSWTLRMRQKAQIVAKIGANIVMGAFYGSLFWQVGFDEWYMKAMLLFQLPTFTLSTSFPQVQVMSAAKTHLLEAHRG